MQRLAQRGIETEEMIAEDWGWYVRVQNEGFRLAICCGHQDGDNDEFLCFTDPSTPVVKKFFKKVMQPPNSPGSRMLCSRFFPQIQTLKMSYGQTPDDIT